MSNQFKKAFKGIDSAIKQGTARALNRALSSSKTKMTRALRNETGLKTEVIATRTRARKAKANSLDVILGIAIKFAIGISKFSPSGKTVKAQYKDGTKRARLGVTARVGQQPRQLVPGGFLLDNAKGPVVVGRKAAYDSAGKYIDPSTQSKLISIKTEIFTESAKANEAPVKKHMVDTFNKIVSHEIEFAVGRKFQDNK